MKASDLSGQQVLLFVLQFKVLLQIVNVRLELPILLTKSSVELLLEIQISPHICHFSVPEVELVTLMVIILLSLCQSALNLGSLSFFQLQVLLQFLHPLSQGILVSVESSSKLRRFVSLFLCFSLFIFKLLEPLFNFFLLSVSLFDS